VGGVTEKSRLHFGGDLPPDTGERPPPLTSARQAGTRLTYPGRTKGWVDLGCWSPQFRTL